MSENKLNDYKMGEYIDINCLWKCETCFNRVNGKCITWCDAGEAYRPSYPKLKLLLADVEPVIHAEWIEKPFETYIPVEYDGKGDPVLHTVTAYQCSLCGEIVSKKYPYCHCGAKMAT